MTEKEQYLTSVWAQLAPGECRYTNKTFEVRDGEQWVAATPDSVARVLGGEWPECLEKHVESLAN